ncbi:hypothetical protein ACOME3_004303 [Neoechinorhynchus agilis]
MQIYVHIALISSFLLISKIQCIGDTECDKDKNKFLKELKLRVAIESLTEVFAKTVNKIYQDAYDAEYNENVLLANATNLTKPQCNRFKLLRRLEERMHKMLNTALDSFYNEMVNLYNQNDFKYDQTAPGCEMYMSMAKTERKRLAESAYRTKKLFIAFEKIQSEYEEKIGQLYEQERDLNKGEDKQSCKTHYLAYSMATQFRSKIEELTKQFLQNIKAAYAS